MRIAKWILISLGGITVALVVAAFVVTRVIDPNRYRGKVEAIVTDLAGRPFVIEGNLAIAWYPWLGIQTGAAHLDNPPGIAGPPLMEWQSAYVAARLWPLIHGQVQVDHILLRNPRIHLRRDGNGHANWDGLGGPPFQPRDAAAAPRSASSPPKPLEIAGIEIHDGTLDYVDEAGGTQASLSNLELANLELDVGEWRMGQPLFVRARFVAHTQSLPDGLKVGIAADRLVVDPSPFKVAAPKLTMSVSGAHSEAKAEGDLTYETTSGGGTRAHGSIKLQSPSLRKLANDLALNQTLPHDPTTLGPLELTTTWSYDDGSLAAKPLALKLDEVNFNGWLQRTAAPQPMWDFELHGDRIDLGRYVEVDSRNKKPFELPVETLRAIHANGSVIFDQVVLADTRMADVHLKLQTPEGKP